ncbi:MAG: GntR family transcriptional regulator [Silicimonas sp.]|nr:GntR family transcriptional regulator [Silicimonas sp.]
MQDLSQGEAAYRKLHAAILDGQYQPGDRLREVDVSLQLGLSRTPIREALRKLESDGIVEHRPRIGAVIRRLSHTEVVELYEMRLVLERTAAEMAAKHASVAEIDVLEDINRQIGETKDDATTASALNQRFHQCIYMSTRNRFLLDSARALNNALILLGPTTLADEARIRTVHTQHRDIIAAIRSGDGASAGAAAEAHLQTSLRHRLKVMQR